MNTLLKRLSGFPKLRVQYKYTMNSGDEASLKSILNFWFPDKPQHEKTSLWFGGGAELDGTITSNFGGLVAKARNGELPSWEDTSNLRHCLGFIILIDQFCRNIYRGTPNMYSHDHKALALTLKIIEEQKDQLFSLEERSFLLLPLEHHEDKNIQEQSVAKFKELAVDGVGTPLESMLNEAASYAEQHKVVIDKYGRFPKRNAILGRPDTLQEENDLKNWKYYF